MNKFQCFDKEVVRNRAKLLGFEACGFARAEAVEAEAVERYDRWIALGYHSCMDYAERYSDLRSDPTLLHDGAKTVISVALNYYPAIKQPQSAPQFAYYAYGKDYHLVMRDKLRELAAFIEEETGCNSRVCVDTTPIRERYWAAKAGVGFVGVNNQLIIPNRGSYFFLGEILTSFEFTPDKPTQQSCGGCRKCVEACPTNAITADGLIDCNNCLSCQLIENRNELLPNEIVSKLGNRVYGCDECQLCCPHNLNAQPTAVKEFEASREFLALTSDTLRAISDNDYQRLFKQSAVKRVKKSGLIRNNSALSAKIK